MEKFESTERVKKLLTELYAQANTNRSKEWFKNEELENIAEKHSDKPVIIRKAYAIEEMLTKMTDENLSERTLTYKINDGELIVGVLPMGSNGLGKVFPNYLTENEQRAGSFTNRSELSILGHNTVNYNVLLNKGLKEIITDAENKKSKLQADIDKLNEEESDCIASIQDDIDAEKKRRKFQLKYKIKRNKLQYSIDFYEAVLISCNAVKNYSLRFADLASDMAAKLTNPEDHTRKDELLKIAEICRKVPMEKPGNFHEALQSIYTFHVALHASLDFVSLGRLDQVLMKYIESEADDNVKKCTELFECFIIKAASRLNLTMEYLLEQDHVDFSAALGIHPYYLDQRAGVNNFLQNIIVGGKTPDGIDATNRMTYIILNAFENVNLSTPGIYVRLHDESPKDLVNTVAAMLSKTENLPGILNDEVLIPALYNSMLENEILLALPDRKSLSGKEEEYMKICHDYCVDGCWEPILNGISDWTFGMVNGMDILQCALNRGATLDTNPGTLRGAKKSILSDKVESYDTFQRIFKEHMRFFIDQSTFGLYDYYMLDEFVNPSPLFSSVLGTCMERGRDKSWGGTEYNIGGTILIGVPDMINTIAAIKKWVFYKKKYTLEDVLDAMRNNFKAPVEGDIHLQSKYSQIKTDFDTNSPKFGNNDENTTEIGDFILETFCDAIKSSKELSDKIFLKPLEELYDQKSYIERCHNYNNYDEEQTEILKLRKICGYYGTSLQERFGKDFNIRFTAGCGTFEQYPLQGSGVAASPNRSWGAPLAPNLSPYPGTADKTAAHILTSLKGLRLNRLAAGAITDLCIDSECFDNEITKIAHIKGIINKFVKSDGNMMTLAIGNKETYQEIYRLSYDAIHNNDKKSYEELQKYKHINVRVGGWQAPFITMSLEQQKSYADRVLKK